MDGEADEMRFLVRGRVLGGMDGWVGWVDGWMGGLVLVLVSVAVMTVG